MEVPLLRESQAFADRLSEAVDSFGENIYHRNRRINWSYRYCEEFYAAEAALFCRNPAEYIKKSVDVPPQISDVFSKSISLRQLISVCFKVFAHWAFLTIGKIINNGRRNDLYIYRKCYVDDIELAFDPSADGVLRAVFPFPLSAARQWQYCRYLRRQALPFRLDGNHYALCDLVALLRQRDVRALMRLESRAEIRNARKLLLERFSRVELSDEFNIGSLDFCRILSRGGIPIVNSAHGIGKYFPVHRYRKFNVLNSKQKNYYQAEGVCIYNYFRLHTIYGINADLENKNDSKISGSINLIFLSQAIDGGNPIISNEENKLLNHITSIADKYDNLILSYKPHPNSKSRLNTNGWKIINDINDINILSNKILFSFFSTCHIDDRFHGRKYLIQTEIIRPEIAYDDEGDILNIFDIENLLKIELKA